MSIILTCNAGSDNTKLAAYGAKTLERKGHAQLQSHAEITEWLCAIGTLDIGAISHRVVHGGGKYTTPELVTPALIAELKQWIPLAPLHQPAAIRLIEEVGRLYPKAPQIACFDTGFHAGIPAIEQRFALPRRLHDEGLRRYGFHGLSYEYIASVLPEKIGEKAKGKVVVAHLGGGSSACAMKNLKSIAGTMGFSTLDGMMMATRCGALDAGALLYLLEEKKMTTAQVTDVLYHESGLKGVSGISGRISDLIASPAPAAKEAVALYCHLAARQIAGLLPALGGLDVLVFTGGIGEHVEPVRQTITAALRFAGDFAVEIIPTDEEIILARAGQTLR
jgi:acetate kinase